MSSAQSPPSPPRVIEDCRGVLQVLSDGTVRRSSAPFAPVPILDFPNVEFKDAQYDRTHNLTLRLYKPAGPHNAKLPVLFYFHGGGYCIGSFTWPRFHNACLRLSSSLNAIVVAPDYRLAPEHRLPAAIEDAVSAIEWVRPGSDPFLEDADFDNVFFAGESAGGNMAHHLNLRLGPKPIRGYILLLPFFGGVQRTESEEKCPEDAFLNLEQCDQHWRLALPAGATRDDPLVNPFGPGGPRFEEAELRPMLVVVGGKDLLRDRGIEYGRRLKELGKNVEVVEIEGQQHAFLPADPLSEAADQLLNAIKKFMDENRS